jgi:RNA polymerase sigma factor (sigma-70 family)
MTKAQINNRIGRGIPAKHVDHSSLKRLATVKVILARAEDVLRSNASDRGRSSEIELFKAMHACIRLLHSRPSMQAKSGYTTDELLSLHHRIVEHVVNSNVGLVYDMLRRSPFWGGDDAELISAGFWALFQSVAAFDPWRGFRFSTYACSAILRAFQHVGKRDLRRKLALAKVEDREALLNESELRSEETSLLTDRLRNALESNAADLTPTEQFIIQRRFLQPGARKADTLEAVGRMVKLSKERVRQIQLEALGKLREALRNDPVLQGARFDAMDTLN